MVDVLGRTVLELAIEGVGDIEQGLDRVEQRAGEAGGRFSSSFALKAAAGITAAGAAIEGFNRNQQEMTVNTRQLAARMGENEEAVRSWATEMTDAGFPLEDAVGLMDLANRRGLEGKKAIQDYAQFWDTLGDATGESAVALAEAGVGLAGIGIAAGEEGEAVDALAFIMDNTTSSVGEFLTFVERTGPELREMNADVDDAAAIMGVLETELGLTGRVARTEFRQAINDSDGTLKGMLDTLGISQAQFDAYRGSVEGAGVAIERNADITNAAFTPLQQLQATIGDVMFENAAFIESLGSLSMILMGGGPLIAGIKGLIAIAPVLGGAFHLMLGPIGLVTAAIALLAAAFATDFMGIRTETESVVNDVAMHFGSMGDTVNGLADEMGVSFDEMKNRIKADMKETGDDFDTVVRRIKHGSEAMTEAQWDAVEESGNAWVTYQEQIRTGVDAATTEVEEGVDGMAEDLGSLPEKGADELLANQFHLTDAATQLVNFMDEALSPMEEKAQARAFLASDALGNALGSPNPLVRQKAAELQQQALDVLNDTSGFYADGQNSGLAWAYGAGSNVVLSAAFGAGVSVAASFGMSTRGLSPPKHGPLKHIDKDAEHVVMAWINAARGMVGEAFGVGADLAGGLARGLVPDLAMPTLPSLAAPAMMAPAMAGAASSGGIMSAVGGGTVINNNLTIAGKEPVVSTAQDIIHEMDRLGSFRGDVRG